MKIPTTIDVAALADLCNVTPQAVFGWIKAGMPVVAHGKQGRGGKKTQLDLAACVRWWFHENHERLQLDRERSRLTSAQARKIERGNAHADGDLVSLEAMTRVLSSHIVVMRNILLGLPSVLAPQLAGESDPHVCKALLDREIRHALVAVSELDPAKLPKS